MSLKQEMKAVREQLKARQEAKIERLLPKLISSGAIEIGVFTKNVMKDRKVLWKQGETDKE